MKKILLIASMLFAYNADAQITLEHTYNNSSNIQVYNLENEGYKYVITDYSTKSVRIYNTDHSLWKTVNVSLPSSVTSFYVTYVSTKLFNTDGNVEFLIWYYENISGNVKATAQCIGENGSSLYNFNDAASPFVVKVGESWKLIYSKYASNSNESYVYSLPGNYITAVKKTSVDGFESKLYPNPVDNVATLSYKLPEGTKTAELSIYNMHGQKLRDYNITSDFQTITIESGNLNPGNYTYQIKAPGFISEGEQFIVR